MRNKIELELNIPEGVQCEYIDHILTCSKDGNELSRKIHIPGCLVSVKNNKIKFDCLKANKKDNAIIKSNISHVRNIFSGLENKFEYKLEVVHVHFPITTKVQDNEVVISNFLGERKNRKAMILPGVEVNIKGQQISVIGNNIEKTGQTAANIELASRVIGRDKRVFQDGIYIISKPGGEI